MFNITLDQLFYLTAPNGSSTNVPEPEDSNPSAKSAILIPPYGGLYSALVPTFPTEILAGSWTSAQAGATAYTCKQEEGGQSLTGERFSFPPPGPPSSLLYRFTSLSLWSPATSFTAS